MYSTLSTVYTCTRTRTYCIILDLLYVEDSVFVLYIYHLTKQSQLERIVYFLSYILIIPIISKQTPCLYISEENMCSFYLQFCFFRGKISLLYFLILFADLFFERGKNLTSVLSYSICRSVFWERKKSSFLYFLILFADLFFEREKNSSFLYFLSYYLHDIFLELFFVLSVLAHSIYSYIYLWSFSHSIFFP